MFTIDESRFWRVEYILCKRDVQNEQGVLLVSDSTDIDSVTIYDILSRADKWLNDTHGDTIITGIKEIGSGISIFDDRKETA